MAVSSVRVTEGSGPYLHTWQRSISSVNREDQYVQLGEPALPTFTALAASISIATVDSHVLCVNAGSATYVRVYRITIRQSAHAGTESICTFAVYRTSSAAPSGGSSVTPRGFDTADTANSTAMTLPSSKGTEAAAPMLRRSLIMRKAILSTASQSDDTWEWVANPRGKPLIIPAGTTNGLVIKNLNAVASATVDAEFEYTETAWL